MCRQGVLIVCLPTFESCIFDGTFQLGVSIGCLDRVLIGWLIDMVGGWVGGLIGCVPTFESCIFDGTFQFCIDRGSFKDDTLVTYLSGQ